MFPQHSEGTGTHFSILDYFLLTVLEFLPYWAKTLLLRAVTIQGILEMATQIDVCQEQVQVELVNLCKLSG